MQAKAVIFDEPRSVRVDEVTLVDPTATDVLVEIDHSAISTGTERLLFTGEMPPFPGLGYPLVPGYESVGRVVEAGADSGLVNGQRVFVPGSAGYKDVKGLFGGSANRVVLPGARCTGIDALVDTTGDSRQAVLLALAATAYHALDPKLHALPELIIGHGVVGRLLARIATALRGSPVTVWETNPERQDSDGQYFVTTAESDERRDYRAIVDASGFGDIINLAVPRLAKGGEIVLAGFYKDPLSFAFPPAFMREARLRIAAEWSASDMAAVTDLVMRRELSLDDLITHSNSPDHADAAYATAFSDPRCLKMVINWREASNG